MFFSCAQGNKYANFRQLTGWANLLALFALFYISRSGIISQESPHSQLMREIIKQNASKEGDLLDFLAH